MKVYKMDIRYHVPIYMCSIPLGFNTDRCQPFTIQIKNEYTICMKETCRNTLKEIRTWPFTLKLSACSTGTSFSWILTHPLLMLDILNMWGQSMRKDVIQHYILINYMYTIYVGVCIYLVKLYLFSVDGLAFFLEYLPILKITSYLMALAQGPK